MKTLNHFIMHECSQEMSKKCCNYPRRKADDSLHRFWCNAWLFSFKVPLHFLWSHQAQNSSNCLREDKMNSIGRYDAFYRYRNFTKSISYTRILTEHSWEASIIRQFWSRIFIIYFREEEIFFKNRFSNKSNNLWQTTCEGGLYKPNMLSASCSLQVAACFLNIKVRTENSTNLLFTFFVGDINRLLHFISTFLLIQNQLRIAWCAYVSHW